MLACVAFVTSLGATRAQAQVVFENFETWDSNCFGPGPVCGIQVSNQGATTRLPVEPTCADGRCLEVEWMPGDQAVQAFFSGFPMSDTVYFEALVYVDGVSDAILFVAKSDTGNYHVELIVEDGGQLLVGTLDTLGRFEYVDTVGIDGFTLGTWQRVAMAATVDATLGEVFVSVWIGDAADPREFGLDLYATSDTRPSAPFDQYYMFGRVAGDRYGRTRMDNVCLGVTSTLRVDGCNPVVPPPDAGPMRDAGPGVDAGPDAGAGTDFDAGVPSGNFEFGGGARCDCGIARPSPHGPSLAWLSLAVAALLWRRRRA